MSRFNHKESGLITVSDLKKNHVKGFYWFLFTMSLLLSFVCLAPPLWVLVSSVKDVKEFFAMPPTIIPQSFHPEKIIEVWKKLNFWKYYLNSSFLIAGSILCALLFNGLFGYALSIMKPKGGKILFVLVLWSLMLPSTVSMVPLYINIVHFGMVNTFWPLWLMNGANAFFVLLFKTFFDKIPKPLIEAARLDGCGDLGIFFKIVLPLSKSICMVIIILTINAMWSEFIWSFLILQKPNLSTVMVKIYKMTSTYGGFSVDEQMIALTFSIIPPVILFTIFQRYIMDDFASSGIKG